MSLKQLGYTPRRHTVRLVLDDTLRVELEEARADLTREMARPDRGLASEAERRVDEAEAAAEEAAVSFVFQAIPRTEYDGLVASLPPTEAQLEIWKQQDQNNPLYLVNPPAYDYDKFPPHLIAASLVEPETTEAEVMEMWDGGAWSDAIWKRLVKAAEEVNEKTTTLPTSGTGSAKMQGSGPVSATQ